MSSCCACPTATSSTPRAGTTEMDPRRACTASTVLPDDARRALPQIKPPTGSAIASPQARHRNINTVAPFLTLAYLYEESPDSSCPPISTVGRVAHGRLAAHRGEGLSSTSCSTREPRAALGRHAMMGVLPLKGSAGCWAGRNTWKRAAVHAAYQVPGRSQDRAVVPRLTFDGRRHFANALWARGTAGHHRHSRVHRGRPAARRWPRDFLLRPACSRSAPCGNIGTRAACAHAHR